ncbi:hypothetical protein [Corallococcus caeni]|uniref:Secreted protein n=1 Tax=Corallococcus caeni TaxID=3082388 RepID=A0ABQ6QPZ2_9BACT|nr:hypothetical protein ASNO1_20290 [Corallococcus sp. NO1]
MTPFKKYGATIALGAIVGLGSSGAAMGLLLQGRNQSPWMAAAPQGRVLDDYGAYESGPEGYVAQSDLIVTGRITRVLDARTHVQDVGQPRYTHRLELEVDGELYRNTERVPGQPGGRVVVSVPAAGMDVSMGRAQIAAMGDRHLFFLRRSPLDSGAYVLLRGEHGSVDLTKAAVGHEVMRSTTPSDLIQEVRRYAEAMQLSVPDTVREPLSAVPESVTPVRFYGRGGLPASLQRRTVAQDGVLVFNALSEGAISPRVHVLRAGERCFVRMQWEPGATTGPVAIHVSDKSLPANCEALLDKSF